MQASICVRRGKEKGKVEKERQGYVKGGGDGGRKEDVNGMGKGKEEGQGNGGSERG